MEKNLFLYYISDRVNHKPIMKELPNNQTVIVGNSTSFQCIVVSDLHLKIQWIRGIITCDPTTANCSLNNQIINKVMEQHVNSIINSVIFRFKIKN